MQDGFIKVAAATPNIEVANCEYNTKKILEQIQIANKMGVKVLIFPELCIPGYTCDDLFFQSILLEECNKSLKIIKDASINYDMLISVGLPFKHLSKLFNCAAVIHRGKLLGMVPKTYIPNHNEFYEKRHFSIAPAENSKFTFDGETCYFGAKLMFCNTSIPDLKVAMEICEDIWVADPKSTEHVLSGATLICNLSASDEVIEKCDFRRRMLESRSARSICAYIYADAGIGESTTDTVFAAHNIVAETGTILAESKMFENAMAVADIDVNKIALDRIRTTAFPTSRSSEYTYINFDFDIQETVLSRTFNPKPFIPAEKSKKEALELALSIQREGLKKRLQYSNCEKLILGLSGGIDSTLALIAAHSAINSLGLPSSNVIAVNLPCFATTEKSKSNAKLLAAALSADFREIDIRDTVTSHFKDIGQDIKDTNIVYENAQVRLRTAVLMNLANKEQALVVGTSNMSEAALGWSTYAGDQISMYNVNAGITKTLVHELIKYVSNTSNNTNLNHVLLDILNTPASPELKDAQITEDIIGPYELNDFFLYNVIVHSFAPRKIYRLAQNCFKNKYDKATILKYLKMFYKRFFSQEFKRSCAPDGPKICPICLSPRSDWRMPSDASCKMWIKSLDEIQD